jgi:hypothetical protein
MLLKKIFTDFDGGMWDSGKKFPDFVGIHTPP